MGGIRCDYEDAHMAPGAAEPMTTPTGAGQAIGAELRFGSD